MIKEPVRVMFIGTCRMHDPAHILQHDRRFDVRTTPHRLHTAGQVFRFCQHMQGCEPYDIMMAHLISDYASKCIFEERLPRHKILDDLERIRKVWRTFDAFVIEISALREPFAMCGGRKITINNFSARDQDRHADTIAHEAALGRSIPYLETGIEVISPRGLRERMAAIKQTVDRRPIVWVSHQRPPSTDAQYDVVNKVRLHLANALQVGAQTLSDMFFDPSAVATEMGQAAYFENGGKDLDHITQEAAVVLSERYAGMLSKSCREE